MTYLEIDRHRRRIEAVFTRAGNLLLGDELRADLAKHICVLASGYIEETVRRLVMVHCVNRGVPATVTRYVERQLQYFQNPDTPRILSLVNSLDPALEASVAEALKPEQTAAIDSVVHLRHQIAHGGQATTSIGQQREYFDHIESALVELRSQLA